MVYRFSETINEVLQDGIIFTANNGIGEVKNNILSISDSKRTYFYKNKQWYLNNFPCGKGAVPVLELENLNKIKESIYDTILYKDFTE